MFLDQVTRLASEQGLDPDTIGGQLDRLRDLPAARCGGLWSCVDQCLDRGLDREPPVHVRRRVRLARFPAAPYQAPRPVAACAAHRHRGGLGTPPIPQGTTIRPTPWPVCSSWWSSPCCSAYRSPGCVRARHLGTVRPAWPGERDGGHRAVLHGRWRSSLLHPWGSAGCWRWR